MVVAHRGHRFSLEQYIAVFSWSVRLVNMRCNYKNSNTGILSYGEVSRKAHDSFQINVKLVWDWLLSLATLAECNQEQIIWVLEHLATCWQNRARARVGLWHPWWISGCRTRSHWENWKSVVTGQGHVFPMPTLNETGKLNRKQLNCMTLSLSGHADWDSLVILFKSRHQQ